LVVGHLQSDADLHRKKQFVFFEQGSASLLVHLELVVLDDLLDSFSSNHVLFTLFDIFNEQGFVPVETELVHGIDFVQIIQHEEQNGSLFAALSVDFTSVIDFLHHDLGSFQRSLDLVGFLLGLLKSVN
jgi:hypothetical protein